MRSIALCDSRFPVEGYVGFRALPVNYSQGSGTSKFGFDAVIYGQIGATMRFQTTRLGQEAVKLAFDAYYNVLRPEADKDNVATKGDANL
jgi:hypothetical protein